MDIRAHLQPGDHIVAAQVLGEPTELISAVFEAAVDIARLRLFVGMSLTDVVRAAPPELALSSFVGIGANGALRAEGRLDLVPCHMSALPRLFAAGPRAVDVALVSVSPPDADGWCSLGVVSDYAWHAVQSARAVLAEINDRVPVVAGDTRLHLDQFAATVSTSRPLPEYRTEEPSAIEREIARHVATFIHDGSCVQVGIGKVGEAVLQAIADRRDLGIHAGMLGDTVLDLMREGVITNKAKGIDEGITVAGSVLGSARAVAMAGAEPRLQLRSIGHTHDPGVVAQLSDFVCVNSALEVDILGQVNAETATGRYVGAIGGSVDFLRAAVGAPNGRAVVALPAGTPRGRSRIVPRVERVTAAASDVETVVTEYGIADLRGVGIEERARRIIAIAAPEHRTELVEAMR